MISRKQRLDKKKLGSKAGPTPSPSIFVQNKYRNGINVLMNEQIARFEEILETGSKDSSQLFSRLRTFISQWRLLLGSRAMPLVTSIAEELTRSTLLPWTKLLKSGDIFATREMFSIGIGNVYTTPEMRTVVSAIVQNNVSLITKTSDNVSGRIMQTVTDHLTNDPSGVSLEKDIDKILKETGNFSKNKARLISQDQTRKMVRAVSRRRATELGITKYVWSDMNDSKVRPKHEKLDGREFEYAIGAPPSYSTMPVVGEGFHPGEDIFCRCIEIPIIPRIKKVKNHEQKTDSDAN